MKPYTLQQQHVHVVHVHVHVHVHVLFTCGGSGPARKCVVSQSASQPVSQPVNIVIGSKQHEIKRPTEKKEKKRKEGRHE